jgi:hypothetical protein
MLEIVIVYMLAKNIGNKVEAKGRKRFSYQLLLVALWIGGEIAGGVIGFILQAAMAGGVAPDDDNGFPWMGYLCALAGAALGAIIAFAIANNASPVQDDADFYEIDERGRDEDSRRVWREANDRPIANGDQIQERPATRREDDRIRE